MTTIREILRLRHDTCLTRAEVSASVGVSEGTVTNVVNRARAAGLSWPLPDDLDDAALQARLYPVADAKDGRSPVLDLDALARAFEAPRGRRRVQVTRYQLWREHCAEASGRGQASYSYTRFCELLRAHLARRATKAEARFVYAPGQWGMADFSGKTLALQTGTGARDLELFVACLAHSRLIYAEAVPAQTVRCWTMAHRRAFEYFGGVPQSWVIDNLKAGVARPDRENPHLNASFREFSCHYGIGIVPARVRKPTDKGLVESAVRAVQTRILLPLREQAFLAVESANAAIRVHLEALNNAPMRGSGESRRAAFEARERTALAPLPRDPWEWGDWIIRKVAPSSHIAIERNHYSVPHAHIGRQVAARVSEHMVEVFLEADSRERIAAHHRTPGRNRYMTREEHLPVRLQTVMDIRSPAYDQHLLTLARRIGPHALAWAEECLASRDFPQQAFTTVRGMTRLVERHAPPQVDAACAEALKQERFTHGFLRAWLSTGSQPPARHPDDLPETIPAHANIRGGAYYDTSQGEPA